MFNQTPHFNEAVKLKPVSDAQHQKFSLLF